MGKGEIMHKKITPVLIILLVSILSSGCLDSNKNNNDARETVQKVTPQTSSTSPGNQNLQPTSGSFGYGDELSFYQKDEKSNKNPTAISVVKKYLESTRKNDFDSWMSTLASDRQKGFSKEANGDFGVINLEILDLHYEADTIYKHNILKSEKAIQNGWTAENIAIVYALYNASYDHTKVPSSDGKTEWHFWLIRKDTNSPWLIQDWGV